MELYLYDVNFTGRIPESFSHLTSLIELDMSSCNLSGPIPRPLWNLTNIEALQLNNNHLEGPISHLLRFEKMRELSLGNNNLVGQLDFLSFNRSWTQLEWLDFSSNSIQRKWSAKPTILLLVIKPLEWDYTFLAILPPLDCKDLELVDLGNNELNDTFPKWLGTLPSLMILKLTSNKLHGPIITSRTEKLFAQIQVIDLSLDGFSGDLPVSLFENFEAMKIIDENNGTPRYVADEYYGIYTNSLIETTKGSDLEFHRVLTANIIINLSKNRFEGYIPRIIGDLVGRRSLNLSHNRLEGVIPASLQHLSLLESLDLSSNKIGGKIPQQLASLTFLAVLNLSHNHLVGCIPKGKQFNTFENSSYQGNAGLRRFSLSKDCGGADQVTTPVELDQEDGL